MNKKIPFIVYLFFILVYANQGFSALPSQCYYYLTRETWKLSATMLGIIAFIGGIAWCIKPLFGILTDCFPIKNYRAKYYLYINCFIMILVSIFIIVFGIANMWIYMLLAFCFNFALCCNDVANDSQMVILEQKYKLQGKVQALQWSSFGIAGLIVTIFGAWIASTFPEPINYKIAEGLVMILPIITIVYLTKYYKEEPIKVRKKLSDLKFDLHHFKDIAFVIGLLFILCLRFSPSFGTALSIKLREEMMVSKMFRGWLGATGTVLGLLGYLLYYWKCYKFPMKKLLYFTIVFSGLTNLCYLWIPNKWTVMVYNILFGAFDGIAFLTVLAFIAQIVPKGAEGVFYALVTSVNNLAGRLGGIAGGMIYDNFGYNWNVVIASITTLVCIFFIPYLKTEKADESLVHI